MPGCAPRSATSRSTGPPAARLQYHGRAAHLMQAMVIEAVTGQDYRDVIRDKVLAPLGLGQRHLRRRAGERAGALRRHLCAGAARQLGRVPGRRPAERRRLCDGARHGGVLPDAARQGPARQCAAVLAAADRLRLAQSHRRARRRADERHPDASRPRPACARRERPHPRPRHARRARDLRSWRRRVLLFLGRPDERRLVHLSDQLRVSPTRGIRPGSTASPTWCTPRSIDPDVTTSRQPGPLPRNAGEGSCRRRCSAPSPACGGGWRRGQPAAG